MKTTNSKRDKELQDRFDQLLEEEKQSKTSSKEDQSMTLKELRELGISTDSTLIYTPEIPSIKQGNEK
jgi:hypothetical protein